MLKNKTVLLIISFALITIGTILLIPSISYFIKIPRSFMINIETAINIGRGLMGFLADLLGVILY